MPAAPTLGLVVPNFNGARFLRDTLESVLGQDRPPDDVLVMDGGSTDGSVELLRSYGRRLRFVSEHDEGQADAIAKGFAALSTDLVGWLNSDDRLMPGALHRVAAAASSAPAGVLFHGDAELVDEHGRLVGHVRGVDLDHDRMRSGRGRVVQPGSFYRAGAVRQAGGIDSSWHLLMDLDLWIRLLRVGPAVRLPGPLAQFRIHGGAKSSAPPWRYYRESLRMGRVHEADRAPRAMARRGLAAARHLALFTLGLSRDRLRPVQPPGSPARLAIAGGGPEPAALASLRAAGQVLDGGVGPEAVVHTFGTLATSPRAWGPQAILVHRGPLAAGGALLDRPVAFALGDAEARQAFLAAGIPECRIGRSDAQEDWIRALEVASGAWPGRLRA